ncbi:cyclic nucleotide-binding domain-containing protein [Prosthecomicrobium sp. N25]|uniref:cyclic nucleotide-binding domain-containing protein n=1 Tax=Prosthecomicrobium sp. N25 TaxID=3129254 RepID=UPI003076E6C2
MTLERDIQVLQEVPFLAGVPAEPLRLIAFSAERRELAAGEILFREGEAADGAALVMGGRIDLRHDREDGPATVLTAGPGTLLGELALLVETRRPATAVAAGRAVTLLITRRMFRRVLEEYPDVTLTLQQRVAERLTALGPNLGSLAARLEALDRD